MTVIVNLDNVKVECSNGKVSMFNAEEGIYINFKEQEYKIKLGDKKVKVSMSDFMQAFRDMLEGDVFEMDQIDSAYNEIENALVETRNQLEYANEVLADIRGGY